MCILLITNSNDSAVKRILQARYKVTVLHPQEAKCFTKWTDYKFVITYRCQWIVPKRILRILSKADVLAVNIHPSLLPLYAGLNPWLQMFSNKETKGGVTIHLITEKVDAGEILLQQPMYILPTDTIDSARKRADKLAANMITNLIKQDIKTAY